MRTNGLTAVLMILPLAAPVSAWGGEQVAQLQMPQAAADAVSSDPETTSRAIAALRAMGPKGLDALFEAYSNDVAALRDPTGAGGKDAERLGRVRHAIECVAMQKDAAFSRLYWYTDLDAAKRAAAKESKPILSLRMLGRLDEELSCANSRFFRTVLYANRNVSEHLREHYVLHWHSVRPVPRLTVDFGDGRTLCTTITGNSAHYVLDARGRVIDAIPGLHGPAAFLNEIVKAETVARQTPALDESGAKVVLTAYHAQAGREIQQAWAADLARIGTPVAATQPAGAPVVAAQPAERAVRAQRLAVSKSAAEIRAIDMFLPTVKALDEATNADQWLRLAELHLREAKLDDTSRSLLRAKHDDLVRLVDAVAIDFSRSCAAPSSDRIVAETVARFERSVAEDTVRNRYQLHRRVHEWLAEAVPTDDLVAFDMRVYADLFETPLNDRWMGLLSPDVYTALPAAGAHDSSRATVDVKLVGG